MLTTYVKTATPYVQHSRLVLFVREIRIQGRRYELVLQSSRSRDITSIWHFSRKQTQAPVPPGVELGAFCYVAVVGVAGSFGCSDMEKEPYKTPYGLFIFFILSAFPFDFLLSPGRDPVF